MAGEGENAFCNLFIGGVLISLIGWDYKCWRIARRM
jgi:hypothetical protein